MAKTSTYPIILPKPSDLIVGTQTYTSANPVLGNPTKNFTVQSIIDLVPSSGGGGGSGTVTSVSGTGTVSGLTLTGTVTSSGDLTLGGVLSLTSANVTNALGFTPSSFDGDYNNLTNTPTLFDGAYSSLTGLPTLFDGDYDNLTNKPSIPDAVFKNFAVDGQTTVVADSISDTLTLVAGANVTITTDATTDAITISAISDTTSFATDITVNGVLVGAGSNANADENTRIGALSLGQSSGNFNTAVGWSALRYNTTGQYNTAIGNASMSQYIITGSSNVGVGYRTLRALSSGLSNVAVGKSALVAIGGGSGNVAIGSGALDSLVNSDFNVSLGLSSLGGLVVGERNVAIGRVAGGVSRNNLNDSVFIGDGSSSNNDGQTNQIVIGASATGNGSNTVTLGNSSITELHVGGNGAGLVLKSPNGTAYAITVTDAGALVATYVP